MTSALADSVARPLAQLCDDRRVLVLGFGVSGEAALRLLLHRTRPAALAVADEVPPTQWSEERQQRWRSLRHLGVEWVSLGRDTMDAWDLVVVSPGFPPWHAWLGWAQEKGREIFTEFELGYLAAPPGTWIGVTGTNGKTTTTQWLGHLLATGGFTTLVCGNVGIPVSQAVLQAAPGSYYVVELSSFQLYWARHFRPHIGVLLNVDIDHLDWHTSPNEYVTAKMRLFAQQTADDWAIVNVDERHLWERYQTLRARLLTFGLEIIPGNPGIGLRDDWIVLTWDRPYPVGTLNLIASPYPFMRLNLLAAILASVTAGLPLSRIRSTIPQLFPPAHRCEWIGRVRGVDFYDDSKATNVHAVRWALMSMHRPVVLIAGGLAKGQRFTPLRSLLRRKARGVILLGQARTQLRREWRGLPIPVTEADTMEEAVRQAMAMAHPGDVVLLSPGCASFDMFRDYAHRGEVFRAAVRALQQEERP